MSFLHFWIPNYATDCHEIFRDISCKAVRRQVLLWRIVENDPPYLFLCSLYRSAPTSPSQMGGMYTPDSLSREGSPTPENEDHVLHTQQLLNPAQHRPTPVLHPSAAELRISQSAPPSPAGTILQGENL